VLNTRSHDLDLTRWVAVQASELLFFFVTTHTDRIRASDDPCLGTLTALRLGISAFSFDAGQCVKRRHEWNVALVLDAVSGNARQPVVRMDDIGRSALTHIFEDEVGEIGDDAFEIFFAHVVPTRWNMDHSMIGFDENFSGQPWSPRSGVRRDLDTRMRKTGHEFTYVDIHATRITSPRLSQRRGVE
jgi:hypothetical protein